MNIYKDLFTNVRFAATKQDRLDFVEHFVSQLKEQKPHLELVYGRGQCNLIQTILTKYNIPHQTTVINNGVAIFEFL